MKLELFDTHAHYNDEKFDEDREEIIEKVYQSGVTKLVNAGYSLASSKKALEIAKNYNWMYVICGISPNDIPDTKEEIDEQIAELEELIEAELRQENQKYSENEVEKQKLRSEEVRQREKSVKSVESSPQKTIVTGDKSSKKIVAIGEIGLDYYWNKENKDLQQYAFLKQIDLANRLRTSYCDSYQRSGR